MGCIQLKTEVPGPRSREILARRDAAVSGAGARYTQVVVERAEGALVHDVDGNTLIDMAEDVRTLVDHLELDTVHIAGASMGGMIVQVFAGTYPERVNSVGIIYSATGRPFSRLPSWELIKTAMTAPGKNATAEEWLEFEVNNGIVYNGPDNLPSREELRQRILAHRARSDYKVGTVRQFDAILGTGSLLRFTRAITAPTVVIHGRNDPLVPYQNGRVVAKNIRNSRFALIEGMGHDLPEPVWEPVTSELLATFDRGASRSVQD